MLLIKSLKDTGFASKVEGLSGSSVFLMNDTGIDKLVERTSQKPFFSVAL
jgi:hypothetical protein